MCRLSLRAHSRSCAPALAGVSGADEGLCRFPRHPLAFRACLGESDGDCLFAAFHPAALSTFAAFRFASLVTVHLAFHLLAGAPLYVVRAFRTVGLAI